mgnify:CR=1 FL=1
MSKYTTLKQQYSVDITRVSDGLPFAMPCSNIVFEGDTLYPVSYTHLRAHETS